MQKFSIRLFLFLFFTATSVSVVFTSCKHEIPVPADSDDDDDDDNSNGGGNNWIPCDSDSVYFNMQILPFLVANCAMSGCHDAASHEDGVILTSYQSVMNSGIVSPGNAGNSDLYEVITETDPTKRMPPSAPLSSQQIQLIQTWIQQGAQNLNCSGGCDTSSVTWSGTIRTIIQNNCQGCHTYPSPGGGYDLSTYTGVSAIALSGYLMGTVQHSSGYSPMPKNTAQLSACDIAKLRIWVAAGAPNN